MNISRLLLTWFEKDGRDLPWRATKDPYFIWISEIILQQTRVAQGIDYYLNFIKKFPDIHTLADSEEMEVLKAWEGLGYYSRARNLRESAKYIVEHYNGKFPENYDEIIALKGIGPYTAGAISSIAFNEPRPAIDGNVKRVISRLFGLTANIKSSSSDKDIARSLNTIFDRGRPSEFNQAIMDLGAMICVPRNPLCGECPLSANCYAFKNDVVNDIPYVYQKRNIRIRYFTYFIISSGDGIILSKRKKQDIWKSLYEFPLLETNSPASDTEKLRFISGIAGKESLIKIFKTSSLFNHQLSHQKIYAHFVHVSLDSYCKSDIDNLYFLSPANEISNYPLPRLIEKYLENNPF